MKYAKTVVQLEKGLPPNGVVPILKEKVESMRQKVWNVYQLGFVQSQKILKCLILKIF